MTTVEVYLQSRAEPNALHPFDIVFFKGVAEQFAIAEAKLRAWASVDDDEDEDMDSDGSLVNGQAHTSFSRSAGTNLFHLTFISFCSFTSETSLKQTPLLPPHLPQPHPNCPSILRCSDFMLLPQTPPRPMLSQEPHASLSAVLARPLLAQQALACPTAGRSLTTTHIHPRPTCPLCPTTAQAPF